MSRRSKREKFTRDITNRGVFSAHVEARGESYKSMIAWDAYDKFCVREGLTKERFAGQYLGYAIPELLPQHRQ